VELSVLIDDEALEGLRAAHGLSILLSCIYEEERVSVLFDTGPSDATLLNADAIKARLSEVDVVALSHGHYDHTGGLLASLKRIGKSVPVVADPEAFEVKLAYKPALTYIGSPFKPSHIEEAGGRLILTVKPLNLADHLILTGRIPRGVDEPSVQGLFKIKDGELVNDEVVDDRAVVVDLGGKALVVAGCAHAGVLNVVDEALRLTKASSVALLAGGFHLFNAPKKRVERVARELRRMNVEKVAPCHCTGSRGIEELVKVYGERCTPLKAGSNLTVEA